ncbi:zinc finger protein 808-like [Culicoides brevitarsis]|uniref:zinc finger protein 808-like n=1 Tax=Culicoides brevitarsis TaxID=469753 RepID=UPI00307B35EA
MYPQPDGASIFLSRSRTHLEIMNFDPRRERCELCGKPHMLKKAEVVEHRLKRHFFPNPEDTKCPGCDKICLTAEQKMAHSHFCPKKDKIRVNFCQICETQFPNYSKYAKHLRKRHNGEGLDKKYMCHYCSATYDTTRELKLHVIRHEDPRPFKCHHCAEDFKGKVGLESHLIRIHFPHIAKYSCNVCDPPVLFAKPKAYNAHINAVHVRTKEREPCPYCGALIRVVGMDLHVRRQHTEHDLKQKFPCGTCGKLFVSQTNLKVHERTHLPEHEREFKCRFCERRFNSRGVCIEHERFHTGEKPYKCDICGKGYARSQTLKDHKREHTGEVFTCQICGKTSTDRGNFRHHMKQHESQLGMKLTLNQEDRRLVKLRVITEEQALRGEGPSK